VRLFEIPWNWLQTAKVDFKVPCVSHLTTPATACHPSSEEAFGLKTLFDTGANGGNSAFLSHNAAKTIEGLGRCMQPIRRY
jgi:hypothetical protein